jgi:hypothetical protein
MLRIRELITLVNNRYPSDCFFSNFDLTLDNSELRADYQAYERAFRVLDPESWRDLQEKAMAHFLDHRPGQRKQGFFNQLNDAFAYQYLLRRGFKRIRVLRETGNTQPDLEYMDGNEKLYCEVKTLGVSNEEITRRHAPTRFRSSIYYELDDGFLNKLQSVLNIAQSQISSQGTNGLIYLLILFDDFTLEHYDRYRQQVRACIQEHPTQTVYVKVGLRGRKYIQKSSSRVGGASRPISEPKRTENFDHQK